MKHLKTYIKIFESSDNIIEDVKERLFDISDKGNGVKVDWVDKRYKDELVVVIKNETGDLEANTFISLFNMMGVDFGFIPKTITLFSDTEMDKIYPQKWKKEWGMRDEIEVMNDYLGIEILFQNVNNS